MVRDRDRLGLHERLCEILGSRNVYYQPPENFRMHYPCIVYSPNPTRDRYADNIRYLVRFSYSVQIIAHDPEFELFDTFPDNFTHCTESGQRFAADNLNHANYTLYY